MSLTLSLNNALSGLRAAQAAIGVISNNVSNAQTVGYTMKTVSTQTRVLAGVGAGVDVGNIERQVDEFLRKDVRRQSSIAGAATVRDEFLSRMDELLGSVSSGGVLNSDLDGLTSSLQALTQQPSSASLQKAVINDARQAASDLNHIGDSIQAMRTDAENQIGLSVNKINENLDKIVMLNRQITRAYAMNQSTAELQDQRDLAVSALSEEMGVQTFVRESGEMVVYTSRGRTLIDGIANHVYYTAANTVNSGSTFYPMRIAIQGADVSNEITTGRLAALKEARDTTLPELSRQVNTYSRALYEMAWAPPATPSTATSPNKVSFYGTLDTSPAAPATQTVNYKGDYAFYDSNGVAYNATVTYTRSGAGPSWDAQLTALTRATDGASPTVTGGLPQTLGTVDASVGGAAPTLSLTLQHGLETPSQIHFAYSLDASQITLAEKTSAIYPENEVYRLFSGVDLDNPASDNARSIKVNAEFDDNQIASNGQRGNPGKLFVSGDKTPSVTQRMLNKMLGEFDTTYSSTSTWDAVTNTHIYQAIGASLPVGKYTLATMASAIISSNASLAADAKSNADFQTEYVASLQSRAAEVDGVSVDEELAKLTVYQQAYAASAKVLSTTTDMFDTLLSIGS